MLEKLGGVSGLVGLVAMLAGIALLATVDIRIAGGVALVVAGIGLLLRGIVQGVLATLGLGGMP